ncbi:MAG TPA: hypothetical protein VK869_14780 [Rubrobacteraceae bacterium]|nr:hypothetical protein [Rubrobacteraceae bacterium]
MKKLFGRLVLLGALAGGVLAARSYLQKAKPLQEVVQITFDDGSTQVLTSNTVEAQEFTDIGRKLVEIGV